MCVVTLLFALDVAAQPPQTVSVDDLSVPATARKHYDAGVAATRSRNWQKAHDSFQEALQLDPKYARAHNALGVVLALMGKSVVEIEAAFRSAILFDPKLPDAHFNLGKFLWESSRPAEAKEELQRVLQLDSRHAAANELLAESMLMTNEEGPAAALMRSLHQRHVYHRASLHLEIAAQLEARGMFELAIEQYELALADAPSPDERTSAQGGVSRLGRRKPTN
jgi:Tfp pilus assembly protein PilF